MNLRQVRKKIKSISSVKKITKAMQLVSAVKMKKAQQLALEGRPYRESLEDIMGKILPSIDTASNPLLQKKDEMGKEMVIFISSNKGLCGAFNMNLFRLLFKKETISNMDFITIGKKGVVFTAGTGQDIIADFSSSTPLLEVSAIFHLAVKHFVEGKYIKVSIIYNRFISTLKAETVKETLLPVTLDISKTTEKEKEGIEYLIEPSRKELFESLLNNYIEEKIRGAILNSEAAEHSARMIAMKNATDNANDVIYNLTLLRNKLRQQKITYELLDMITAKESVTEK